VHYLEYLIADAVPTVALIGSGVPVTVPQPAIKKTDDPVMGNVSTQIRIQQAFESAGIRFIDADDAGGVGVRLISAPAKKRGKPKI